MLVSGPGEDLPPTWAQFSWSVAPSLIAWTAVLVPSLIGGNVLCVSGNKSPRNIPHESWLQVCWLWASFLSL